MKTVQATLNRIKSVFGIDRAVFYTAGSKLFQAAAQVLALGLVAKQLSPNEQGYYYTFQSILALQVFFELGMSNVLIQVTSHESAKIDLIHTDAIPVSSESGARLASLLRYLVRWYLLAAVAFILIVLPSGLAFFSKSGNPSNGTTPQWIGPWCISVIFSASSMLLQAFAAFLEGLGRIASAARIRAMFGGATSIGLILSLFFGMKLFSPSLALMLGLAAGGFECYTKHWGVFKSIWAYTATSVKSSWGKEIWGFQWKIAASWLSGYLIFQFSTPILFKTIGPVEAGKYGMTQQVVNGISTLSMAWSVTRQSIWARFIATKNYELLNSDFFITLRRTVGVNAFFASLFIIGLSILNSTQPNLASRFSSNTVIYLLLCSGIINQVVFTEAIYLRAHKQEPFLITSIVGACIIGVGTLALASYGVVWVALVYFASTLIIGLLWGTLIFRSKKRQWGQASGESIAR